MTLESLHIIRKDFNNRSESVLCATEHGYNATEHGYKYHRTRIVPQRRDLVPQNTGIERDIKKEACTTRLFFLIQFFYFPVGVNFTTSLWIGFTVRRYAYKAFRSSSVILEYISQGMIVLYAPFSTACGT